MTCIVGLVAPDRSVWMGADSAATNSSSQQSIRADSKLFRLGPMLVACTSSYRMIQLLRYHLVLPDYHSTHGSREAICRAWPSEEAQLVLMTEAAFVERGMLFPFEGGEWAVADVLDPLHRAQEQLQATSAPDVPHFRDWLN